MKRIILLTLLVASVAYAAQAKERDLNVDGNLVVDGVVLSNGMNVNQLVAELIRNVAELKAQHKRELAEVRALSTALAGELDYVHEQLAELSKGKND